MGGGGGWGGGGCLGFIFAHSSSKFYMTKYLNKFVKNKENEKWIALALISVNYVISTEQILYQKLWTFMNFHLHEMSVSYIHKGKINSRKLQQQFKARYITHFGN